MKIFGLVAFTLALTSHAAAAEEPSASDDERMTLAGGAWHAGKNVPCAEGVVTSVHSRLVEPGEAGGHQTFESGVVVEFKLPTAPKFLNDQPSPAATVVHYDDDRTNPLMESEKAGDRVQVCLVAFPTPTHDPKTGKVICDPNVDPRGLIYRVYDYKHHAAYTGPDSQHGCGGA